MRERNSQSSDVDARYPVTVITAQGYLEGETQKISNCGALIRCQDPPRLREAATIMIQFSRHESLLVEAEVVWVDFSNAAKNQEADPSGMVVRFKNLSSVGRQRLSNVIARHYLKKVKRLAARPRYAD